MTQKDPRSPRARLPSHERLLQSIVDTSHDAIVAKGTDGTILAWNQAAERLFGHSANEAIGTDIALIVPPERAEEERRVEQHLSAGEPLRCVETLRKRRDGHLVPVELSATPIFDRFGDVLGATQVMRDLTERVRARTALSEENDRFHTLADNMSQLAWMADETGWIFWYNQRWFDYTGTTLGQMQGWGWKAVHHPDHIDRVVARLQRSWDTGEPWEDTFPLRGRDGRYRWFLSRALPIHDSDGRIVRWFGTNTDITEQRAMQEELRTLTDVLAEANQRKDAFLAALSHELRNPLGATRSALQVLGSQAATPSQRDQAHEIAERQIGQMARLLDDLLDVSRITRDRLVLTVAETDLRAAIQDAVAATAPLFTTADVELSVQIPDAPLSGRADAARVQQMLGNVLANSARYTPAGGSATLAVSTRGRELVVVVRDDGIGIAEDMQPKVFELFAQCQPDSAAATSGLGVGLYLTRKLATMHGGSVDVFSEGPGRGSTFTIRLPVLDADSNEPTDDATIGRSPRPTRRVLVIDDERDNAAAMAAMLELAGHTVSVANDGETGIELARQMRPDVVLLDIGMPGMDGHAVCRALRTAALDPPPCIIAVTGWGQERDLERTRAAGFDHHLVKPVDPQRVLELVATATAPKH